MYEIRDSNHVRRDNGDEDEDLLDARDSARGANGKEFIGEKRARREARPQEIIKGDSIVALLLQKKIAYRLDEESLDLTPEFCSNFIDNLLLFGEQIDLYSGNIERFEQIIRACILSSVYEFFREERSRHLFEAIELVFSLIRGGRD